MALSSPTLAVTMGDPAGIGPEIVLKALTTPDVTTWCRPVIVGHVPSLERDLAMIAGPVTVRRIQNISQADHEGGAVNIVQPPDLPEETVARGAVSKEGGEIAVACIKTAAELATAKQVDAVVTAPINKAAMHTAGYLYPGHTELLAELTGTEDFSLVLTAEGRYVFHVTTHVSLRRACDLVTKERVLATIRLAHRFATASGNDHPTIAVLGLNPHAGESGLFGDEDNKEIAPAVSEARAQGIDAEGPLPGDTALPKALHGGYAAVVAMYHDQGHIPFKTLHLDRGVNITVGLPWLRTSVDHGTAFDIAGKGVASEESLLSAMRLAAQLSPQWPNLTTSDR